MPINSESIRITVWLPNAVYKDMHEIAMEYSEPHADFVRRAVIKEIKAIQLEKECLFKKLKQAQAEHGNNGVPWTKNAAKA